MPASSRAAGSTLRGNDRSTIVNGRPARRAMTCSRSATRSSGKRAPVAHTTTRACSSARSDLRRRRLGRQSRPAVRPVRPARTHPVVEATGSQLGGGLSAIDPDPNTSVGPTEPASSTSTASSARRGSDGTSAWSTVCCDRRPAAIAKRNRLVRYDPALPAAHAAAIDERIWPRISASPTTRDSSPAATRRRCSAASPPEELTTHPSRQSTRIRL